MPSVSVLIPFHNHHDYISACLKSLFASSFQDFDVHIYDDGSQPPLVIDPNVLRESTIKVFVTRGETNLGVGAARNRLLVQAQGRFVAWQDADDLSLPERLMSQVRHLTDRPDCLAVGTGIEYRDQTGSSVLRSQKFVSPASRWDGFSGCCASFMLRREVYDIYGNYLETMKIASEDVEVLLRIKPMSAVQNLDPCLYIYRQHGAQTTKSADWLPQHTLFFARHMISTLHNEMSAMLDDPKQSNEQKVAWVRDHPLLNLDVHEVGRLAFEHARLEAQGGRIPLNKFISITKRLRRSAWIFATTWLAQAFGVWKLKALTRLRLARHHWDEKR